MKKFIICCDGGLSNRILGLISGVYVSKLMKRDFEICWKENNWCGVEIDDLFELSNEVITKKISEVFSENLDATFLVHANQTDIELKKMYSSNDLTAINSIDLTNENIIYYNNFIAPFVPEQEILDILKSFKIKESVLNEVDFFCEKNSIKSLTKGLHFRKTDLASSNPINEEYYKNLIEHEKNINFFICSDDEQTELDFSKFPNVKFRKKGDYPKKMYSEQGWNYEITDSEGRKFNYNIIRSRQSVIDGFIDMLILSKTTISSNGAGSFLLTSNYYNKIWNL